jgi:hypothetical protein
VLVCVCARCLCARVRTRARKGSESHASVRTRRVSGCGCDRKILCSAEMHWMRGRSLVPRACPKLQRHRTREQTLRNSLPQRATARRHKTEAALPSAARRRTPLPQRCGSGHPTISCRLRECGLGRDEPFHAQRTSARRGDWAPAQIFRWCADVREHLPRTLLLLLSLPLPTMTTTTILARLWGAWACLKGCCWACLGQESAAVDRQTTTAQLGWTRSLTTCEGQRAAVIAGTIAARATTTAIVKTVKIPCQGLCLRRATDDVHGA